MRFTVEVHQVNEISRVLAHVLDVSGVLEARRM